MTVLLITMGVIFGLAVCFLVVYKLIKGVSWKEAFIETIGYFLP